MLVPVVLKPTFGQFIEDLSGGIDTPTKSDLVLTAALFLIEHYRAKNSVFLKSNSINLKSLLERCYMGIQG